VIAQQQHQPHIADHTTPHNAARSHSVTPHDAIPHDTHKNAQPHENADHYFKEKLKESKLYRIMRLVRVASSFAKSEKLQIFCNLDNPTDHEPKDLIMQATTMYQAVQKSSDRKYPLYFADAVERCALSASIEASEQTSKSAALNQISALLKTDKKEVIDTDCLGKRYLTCMEKGGAASLYSIHGSTSE
jgi:hypothetical protein